MTTEQAAEIIKLLHSLDVTGLISLACLAVIIGGMISHLLNSK